MSKDPLTAAVTEADMLETLRQACSLLGYHLFHAYDSRKSMGEGFPDCVIVGHGTCWFVELKCQGRRPTMRQAQWLEALLRVTTVQAQVLRPEGLDAFLGQLQRGAGRGVVR